MFDSITIKQRSSDLSIGKLAECLLFYDNVNLIVGREHLVKLLRECGINEIDELTQRGLNLYFETEYFVDMKMPNGSNISQIALGNGDMHYRIIYNAMEEFYENSVSLGKLRRKVVKFKNISKQYMPDPDVLRELNFLSFNNNFPMKVLKKFLTEMGIGDVNNLIFEYKDQGDGIYALYTNLNTDFLTNLSKLQGINSNFEPGQFLLSIASALAAIRFAAEKKSHIYTNLSRSLIISEKVRDLIQKTNLDINTINKFQKYVFPQYKNIVDVIDSKEKTYSDLIKLLDKASKFKSWKREISSEKDFIEEYFKAISSENKWITTLPAKIARFIICEALGGAMDYFTQGSIIGTISATTISIFDSFILDSMRKNWKPDQFVNGDMMKFLS